MELQLLILINVLEGQNSGSHLALKEYCDIGAYFILISDLILAEGNGIIRRHKMTPQQAISKKERSPREYKDCLQQVSVRFLGSYLRICLVRSRGLRKYCSKNCLFVWRGPPSNLIVLQCISIFMNSYLSLWTFILYLECKDGPTFFNTCYQQS